MSQTQQTQAVSQASNWPYIDKAAFWKEDKTTMKIVKLITSAIILPLAFFMDLINKGVNYVWSKKEVEVVEEKKPGKLAKIKDRVRATLSKTKNFVIAHKKLFKWLGITAGSGILLYHAVPMLPVIGPKICKSNLARKMMKC